MLVISVSNGQLEVRALERMYPPWWKYGGRFDFWLKNLKMVEQLIRELKLEPVPAGSLLLYGSQDPMPAMPMRESEKAVLKPRPIPGGIRIPHLHFDKEIYLLNEDQWRKFSGNVMQNFKEKLARANIVSFEKVMEISEAVDSLV